MHAIYWLTTLKVTRIPQAFQLDMVPCHSGHQKWLSLLLRGRYSFQSTHPPKKNKMTKKQKNQRKKNILFIPLQRLLQSALTLSILSLHAPSLTSTNTEDERKVSLVYKYEGIFCFWPEKDFGFIPYGAVVGCFIYTLLFEFSCCFEPLLGLDHVSWKFENHRVIVIFV